MIEVKPLSARERISRLRATFVAQMPDRITQIQALCNRLTTDPVDHAAVLELHGLFHRLKGTGRSFGFSEFGAAAGRAQNVVAKLIDLPGAAMPADWHQSMTECLTDIEIQTSELIAPTGKQIDNNDPSFTLTPPIDPGTNGSDPGRPLVYVCDDEELALKQLANQLDCFGYQAVIFTELHALHQAVLAKRPDALIMDIHFPQGEHAGTEAIATLQQALGDKAVPTLFLSARDDFAARLAAVQVGGDAYFHKPARLMDLVAALDVLTRLQQPLPYRILIVDDDAEIANYHSVILQEAGMLTYELAEPSRVLDVLREFRPDLVLMDMYMPQCNGHDLAKLIRQVPDHVGLPIIFLSSETEWGKQFSAMRVGAEGFLTKPVVPQELVAAVAIRAERMRTLRSLMARDSLTGLFNHTSTTHMLENAIAVTKRSGGSLCFAMLDIDNFKLVNDTHGHPIGDQVLLALSRVLQQRLRTSDVIGRYGGEEFAVILSDVTLQHTLELIDNLRQDFSRVVFHSPNGPFSCAFSAGIASHPPHLRMEQLRDAADKALYEAKRSGRNRVLVDSEEPTTAGAR